jgi:hypothetical protein
MHAFTAAINWAIVPSLKRKSTPNRLHGATIQKKITLMVAAVRISNLTNTPEIRLHPMIFYKFKIF